MNSTKASLLFLLLAIVVAFARQCSFAPDNMVRINVGEINLGGEDSPVLDTLRAIEKNQLSEQHLAELLPKRQNFTLEQPLFISRHEVTNIQYRRFLNFAQGQKQQLASYTDPNIDKDHKFRPKTLNDVKYSGFRQPIVNVTWHDANAFCRFSNMRLPSAAEFESAFRLEASLRQPNEFDQPLLPGANLTAKQSKISLKDEVLPAIVGNFRSNRGVFHDVIGNVMEWVQPQDGQHQLMGYSFKQYGENNRLATFHPWKRHFSQANASANDYGFRCVYQPSNPQRLLARLSQSPPALRRNGIKCWQTRQHVGPSGFALTNADNKHYQAGGQLFADELCLLPQKTYPIGPQLARSTVDLVGQHPLGYSHYLLGDAPKIQKVLPFWLDQQEVSVTDYGKYVALHDVEAKLYQHPETPKMMMRTPSDWPAQIELSNQAMDMAVTGVNWWQAFGYCSWQNKRLPFANEWQAAMRGQDGRLYAWGNDYKRTDAADVTPSNLQGLTKTVSEWTATFVLGSDSAIVKGGSAIFDWQVFGRAYAQVKVSRSSQSASIGFRCARAD